MPRVPDFAWIPLTGDPSVPNMAEGTLAFDAVGSCVGHVALAFEGAVAPASPALATARPAAAPTPFEEPLGAYRGHAARQRRQWESIAICPGVFVVVLTDADTEARRVAREIEAQYAAPR
jgi:hypothetical protein